MEKRFASLWFRHLLTDQLSLRRPGLRDLPFVLATRDRGRIVVAAANAIAESQGARAGMQVADVKALVTGLEVLDEQPGRDRKLLEALAEWMIRYTPLVSINLPDGLMLDVSGCTHLWGGERSYLKELLSRLRSFGYDTRAAIADTAGAAWAVARFGTQSPIIPPGAQAGALSPLPPQALRLEEVVVERLLKLGFHTLGSFMNMPRSVLRRRFGEELLLRLGQALGHEPEYQEPVCPPEPYEERLPCLESIRTATGITLATEQLLELLCERLLREGKGLRSAILSCYRLDGKVEQAAIGTNRPSRHVAHLLKLFEQKIPLIEPDLGIELFVLHAANVEDAEPLQETLWLSTRQDEAAITELIDRLAGKIGNEAINRYLPQAHYWPERSYRRAMGSSDRAEMPWNDRKSRPVRILPVPEPIEVTAPVPDYPPILFVYKNERHAIRKADGPERISNEWWLDKGPHRDYFRVEDEQGRRYWLFRAGHYDDEASKWFIHGFFA